jgi:hypothetical protein
VIKFGRFGKLVASGGRLEPFDMGFLDKATSMGYEFRASFKGVMTFPSGPEKPGFDSKSGCCFAASLGRSGRHKLSGQAELREKTHAFQPSCENSTRGQRDDPGFLVRRQRR